MFETNRTVITPCEKEHIDDILAMFHEPDSNKFIAPLAQMNPDQWVDRLTSNIAKNKDLLQYWVVYHKENDDFVGTLNLNKFSDTQYEQIGLHLARKYWNQGYGYELCRPILKYGFEERRLSEIHWIFEEPHHISKKLALKLGFKPHLEMEDEEFGGNLFMYRLSKAYSH